MGLSSQTRDWTRTPYIGSAEFYPLDHQGSPCHPLNSNTLATWCEELTHLKRVWCWERVKAGGEGDNRGWDGWMASQTRWTWVWVNSGSWWWTGRPGVLQSMVRQRAGHGWATELTDGSFNQPPKFQQPRSFPDSLETSDKEPNRHIIFHSFGSSKVSVPPECTGPYSKHNTERRAMRTRLNAPARPCNLTGHWNFVLKGWIKRFWNSKVRQRYTIIKCMLKAS